MKTSTTHQRISKIALVTCALTLAGCAGGFEVRRPNTTIPAEDKAAQMIDYCQRLRAEGDLGNAAGFCRRALDYEPTNQTALVTLARILEQRNAPREAAQAYRAMLVLTPKNIEARYGLGKAYVALEQYNLAREQLEMALDEGGSDPRIFNTLGVVYDQLGEHDEAQEVYRRGLRYTSSDVPLRTNLGLSLVLSGRHGEGLQMLRRVTADPSAGMASRQALAFAYAIAGDMAAAEETALIDLPYNLARNNLAYYESLRKAGIGAPPPPPSEPELADAMQAGPDIADFMEMPEGQMAAVPDSELSAATALAEAQTAQRPWTEWGQLPEFAESVQRAKTEQGDREAETAPWMLVGEGAPGQLPGEEGDQFAMADEGLTGETAGMSDDIEAAMLPEDSEEDSYLSRLSKLIAELPPIAGDSGETDAMAPVDDSMDDEVSAAMEAANGGEMPELPAPMTSLEPEMAEMEMAGEKAPATDAPIPPARPKPAMAAKTGAEKYYAVQLGSFRSQEQAETGWRKLKDKASDLLTDMDPIIQRTDLGEDKGIYYRLRTQPTAARATAGELCGELSKRGIDCLVVKSPAPEMAADVGSG